MTDQTKIDDGGPAFPYAAPEGVFYREGMLLRDYFAGQALLSMRYNGATQYKDDAEACYKMADAMLKARQL